ncbi:MAG: hypothetical protein UX80_C0002G0054 [Candidatus Amesbacteria bacterium GW2011_GWA2_47_11b]|uniref:Methyltransferase type 11 n=3 Tax=Candidatus Amesiibacteriota TaxID=1752730 RepID=A0A0G1UWF1_9BACT|nr:MAG: hypothetical protein UT95_C0003G0030 [Candidatus Curtissbacteria bacterium GW2011_GWB1_40_28]KKU29417.1 MAG: hypothetical protein UX42_C0001G0169 [Microgenomates group bacterium GW2011_GWC1_46_20]KKU58519.1 MAG: hypothetical protein UX80_C0002G0054 [Candidatus Amesbacteria bacterium GW2011_GWA2_47_11b]KKU70358.1 MAG: hypothetical protein UX92_C0001G0026 [Candidatus Amesbacteria bacterium GW2011_GWA1_47_20]KKU83646.1 MAG: hypothetical protein UY11_C0015G0009 [Candidatus Amesbacteria bact
MYYSGSRRGNLYPQVFPPLIGRLKYSTSLLDPNGKSVLVIGDSYGWYAKFALECGAKFVHSLDIAAPSPMLSRLFKSYSQYHHTIESILDFRSTKKYDLAVFFEVIEHLPPQTEKFALQVIAKSLKSNGKLLLSTPVKSLLSYFSDPAIFLGHRHYSPKQLTQLLNAAGFYQIDYTRGGFVYSALDLLCLYFVKWILRQPYLYFSPFVDKVNFEYPHPHGTTLFAICAK